MHCRKYFTVDARDDRLTRIRVLSGYFLAGVSMYRARKATGYTKETVRKYYGILRDYKNKSGRVWLYENAAR
jgi:hypothetical protein